ncbi:MAG: 50S ribosomal protein L18 [Acidobacteria bacterium]|nr:50S ribosomal protein L18 [Acidobacteriota bacterium]
MDARRKREARKRRHRRVRRRIVGTPERPRLVVFRSNKHIYAQVIDDSAGRTVVAASSSEAEARGPGRKSEVAKRVGSLLGRRATERGIASVVFDRGGYLFHGRVRALAEGARESGLTF